MKPPRIAATLAPFFLATAMLLAPLAAGYAWVSGSHADETQLHRHHLLEKLSPNSHHHSTERLPEAEAADLEGGSQNGSLALLIASAIASSPVMLAASAAGGASHFDGAVAALTAAAAAVLLTYHVMPFYIHSTRPQTRPTPPERPPTA